MRQFREIEVVVEVVHDFHCLGHAAFVGAMERGVEHRLAQLSHLDRLSQRAVKLGKRGARHARFGPDFDLAVTQAGADDAVAPGKVIGQALRPGGIEGLQIGRGIHDGRR